MSTTRNNQISVRLSDELLERMEETIHARGFNGKSGYLRYLIRSDVEEPPQLTEEANRRIEENLPDDITDTVPISELGSTADPVSTTTQSQRHPEARETNVAVVGCGGAGLNLVNRLHEIGIDNAETVVIDTDESDINESQADTTVKLGTEEIEKFDDAQLDSEISGIKSFYHAIDEVIGEVEYTFVLTGVGGKTGTFISPYIAQRASQESTVVTVGMLPFGDIEQARMIRARRALPDLKDLSDSLLLLDASNRQPNGGNMPPGTAINWMSEQTADTLACLIDHMSEFETRTIDGIDELLADGEVAVLVDGEFDPSHSPDLHGEYVPQNINEETAQFGIVDVRAPDRLSRERILEIIQTALTDTEAVAVRIQRAEDEQIRVTGIVGGLTPEIRSVVKSPESDFELQIRTNSSSRSSVVGSRAAGQPVADGGTSVGTQSEAEQRE